MASSQGSLPLGAQNLDALDAAIFGHLQKNARESFRALAQKLGVPETTVRFRINRMVGDNTINLTATINPQRLGGVLATLLLKVSPPHREEVTTTLSGWPDVMYLSSCTGGADLLLQVVSSGLAEFNDLVAKRLGEITGVLSVETVVELEVVKAHYMLP
jgi:Lrp/AsnC family transcriptional regulator, regulator for asnA, asnC and gidA